MAKEWCNIPNNAQLMFKGINKSSENLHKRQNMVVDENTNFFLDIHRQSANLSFVYVKTQSKLGRRDLLSQKTQKQPRWPGNKPGYEGEIGEHALQLPCSTNQT